MGRREDRVVYLEEKKICEPKDSEGSPSLVHSTLDNQEGSVLI